MSAFSMSSVLRVSLRRMFGLARPELGNLLLGTFCILIASTAGLLFPQALRLTIDQALLSGAPARADHIAAAMLVVFVVQGVATMLRYTLIHTAGERVVNRLREQLYRSLMEQEIALFDERHTGELANRLASDATVLQSAVSSNISIALRNAITILGGLAFLFYTSPQLTFLMLAVVPPVALGAMACGRRVRKLSREAQDAEGEANHVAVESLAGIRTVRAFTAEDTEVQRYVDSMARAFKIERKRIFLSGSVMGVAGFASYAASILVFWYGGRLVIEGKLTVGSLTSFLVYTLMVAMALGAMSDLWAEAMRSIGAVERVFELIERVPAIPNRGGDTLARVEGRVEFQRVSFRYPTRKDVAVLDELSLVMAPGERVALVGHSGAGKSTIASLLIRLYAPDSGSITLDGRRLEELDPQWLRQQVGVVSQEPLLFSDSIARNIRYGRPDATDAEVEAAARAANAHDFISRFPKGYETLVGERGVQLSGGQKQRVAIARAVLKDSRLLVLDEATSALDAESEHLVKEALDRLMRGRTTLIIAHRLSTVMDADRVLVMDSGRIIQSGTHASLVAEDGLYRRLVEKQVVAA
ncbi:ATP-binding cassette domain-containing protein [Pyxidicoccus fallax]|uniref:ATP-binding cassette domain-containing protein n=1 Tax=Pyxidicoccus fallax TaxID=394095 RepID=A0A848LD02_9BACT|nr:ABC transporter transmembrane domain-containing protein [Pyxidicoccus fallax]NMO14643.1 ATP-binding cassette domain-containing protein [Pyxidicoccus fallax]NPC79524.1 ATP-binding cassette domain-containing protein [Pyxidicoccus fallax]